jgi:cystathionine beta-lyase
MGFGVWFGVPASADLISDLRLALDFRAIRKRFIPPPEAGTMQLKTADHADYTDAEGTNRLLRDLHRSPVGEPKSMVKIVFFSPLHRSLSVSIRGLTALFRLKAAEGGTPSPNRGTGPWQRKALRLDCAHSMKDPTRSLRPSTLCVHAGTHLDASTGGVGSPIFTSTSYTYPNPANENIYPRYFNVPNQRAVARKVAALEKGEDALVFGSGMAAISTVLFAHLKPGDHALFQADLYGGTFHFISELSAFGIEVGLAGTLTEFEQKMRSNTRLLYVESPSNPLLRCLDLAAIGQIASKHGALSVIDNTFATPINQNPIELGLDVVVHSATKYLNGHTDVNAGVVVSSAAVIKKVAEYAVNHGGTLDSHACYQLERGMKTLALRVQRHNENGVRFAEFLQRHPAVARVNYPGLSTHPDHPIAARQMRGFGGMLSFELRDAARVNEVLRRLRVATPALSLGGVETLVCLPSQTSHRSMSPEERARAGISDGLVRVSVGIEDLEDLCTDFDQALKA